jgi:hypothetical protein
MSRQRSEEKQVMPVITLDPSDLLEAAAVFLAALTWPERLSSNQPPYVQAAGALVAHIYRSAAQIDPDWAWRAQCLKPGPLLIEPKTVDRKRTQTVRRLQEALKVARIARPFIAKVELPKPPPLPQDVPRLSLNVVIPYALGDEDMTDPHNFEQRVFRRTVPVLHLVIALERALMEVEAATGHAPSLEILLTMEDIVPWLVETAERLEAPVLAIRQFKVPPDRQISLRLAD